MGTLVHRRITRLRAQLVEAESFGVSEEACDGEAFTSAMLKIAPPAYPRSEIIFIFFPSVALRPVPCRFLDSVALCASSRPPYP